VSLALNHTRVTKSIVCVGSATLYLVNQSTTVMNGMAAAALLQ
jgi:hypothetical protein